MNANNVIDLGPQPQMIRAPLYEDIPLICENEVLDLGPPPLLIRAPSYDDYEVEQLICDGSFEDFQNNTAVDIVIPNPCENCYTFSCNNLSCEEEMDLPPPQPLTRMLTNAHLPSDEPEDNEEVDK